MKQKLMSGCVSMLLALGCSGKLTVDRNNPDGDGGESGSGGRAAGAAGESGILGAPCVPGELLVEAQGSTAEAEVRTLDRCRDGLVCDSEQICVTPPACDSPTDRDCVVYEGADAGGITALTGDDEHLYFVTYGTHDNLGNYQDDGALMAFSFAEGALTTIASGLQGPKALGVTSSHAYFWVDGGGVSGAPARPQLFRVLREGGTPELIEGTTPEVSRGLFFGSFAAAGELAIWTGETATYTMAADADATPEVLLEPGGWWMVTDGPNLLYAGCTCSGASLSRVPLEGGTPEPLLSPSFPFDVSGDYLYGIEVIDTFAGILLTRAAKSGGQWERVRALGGGSVVNKFQLVGERYFFNQLAPQDGSYPPQVGNRETMIIGTASLTSNEPPVRLLERQTEHPSSEQVWAATSDALYWTDGSKIYSRSLEP